MTLLDERQDIDDGTYQQQCDDRQDDQQQVGAVLSECALHVVGLCDEWWDASGLHAAQSATVLSGVVAGTKQIFVGFFEVASVEKDDG